MSHPVGSPSGTSSSNSVNRTSTLPQRPIPSAGVANAPSTLTSAADPESSSCFSQIWTTVSDLVTSIISWIFSFCNWGGEETAPVAAPVAAPRTPAEVATVFIAQAQRLFNEDVLPAISKKGHPRKIALLVTLEGQKVATCTLDLDPRVATVDLAARYNQVIQGLEKILREHTSLTAQSRMGLKVVDLKQDFRAPHPSQSREWATFFRNVLGTGSMGCKGHQNIGGGFSAEHVIQGWDYDTKTPFPWAPHEQDMLNDLLGFFDNEFGPRTTPHWTRVTSQA